MFLAEGREHLQELNLAVVRIEETPDDQETRRRDLPHRALPEGHERDDGLRRHGGAHARDGGRLRAAAPAQGRARARSPSTSCFQCLDALSAAVESIDETGEEDDPAGGADREPAWARARPHARAGGRARRRRRAAARRPRRAGRRPPRDPDLRDARRGRLDAGRARLHGAVGARRATARRSPASRRRTTSTRSTAATSTPGWSPSAPTPRSRTRSRSVPEVAEVHVFEAVADAALDAPDEVEEASPRRRPPVEALAVDVPAARPPRSRRAAAEKAAGRQAAAATSTAAPRPSASTPSGWTS